MSSFYSRECDCNFEYVLDNFENLVGEPLLVYDECEKGMEDYIGHGLTDEEKEILKKYVKEMQQKMYEIRREMIEMDDNMYEEWYNWRTEGNYHSYDSYPIEKQIEMWENFKRYYDTIQLCESESEWDIYEEDYDY